MHALVDQLVDWYTSNKRELPWRQTSDPYKIWISETMLQQTTSAAVIPFYERFVERLPTVEDLASASQDVVYELWAGLGYYSRARNLQKAAREIVSLGQFPETFEELIKLPGLGPYTARAVSSIAFSEPVGVVDGNTIRVFSRLYALREPWWMTGGRAVIQDCADEWASHSDPSEVNQALMELGASTCRPVYPACLLCPLSKDCKANQMGSPELFPLSKPKKPRELWSWQAQIIEKDNKVLLVKNPSTPFLKKQWLLPGEAKQNTEKPKHFDFQHSITHHDIYVSVEKRSSNVDLLDLNDKNHLWVSKDKISSVAPVSLIKKALAFKR